MRKLLVAMLFLAIGTPAWAQKIERIEIVEYGIYTADKLKSQRDPNGQLHSTIGNVRRAETTTTIPAELGVKFGIKYRVIGEPDGQKIAIRKLIVYPPSGVKPPNSPQPLPRSEVMISPQIGQTVYTGFEFDDQWELVPGIWAIQLWQGNRLLAEQRFTVVARRST
jgi:hypothetical protein